MNPVRYFPAMIRGQAGGIACAKKQQDEALARYIANPNICKQCGDVIDPGPRRKGFLGEARAKRFCNRSCSGLYNNLHRADGVRTGPLPKPRFCVTCKTQLDRKSRKYCSRECLRPKGNGLVEFRTKAELHEHYRAILPKYSWQAARSRIRRNAFEAFMRSGEPKECAVCGYGHRIDVCHIKSVSSFPDTATVAEINDLSNLVALCPNHHWEFDNEFLTAGEWKRIRKPRHAHDVEIPGSTPAACNQFNGECPAVMGAPGFVN